MNEPDAVGTAAAHAKQGEPSGTTSDAPPADTGSAPPVSTPFSWRYLSFVSATGLSSSGDAAWVIALTATVTRLADAAVAGAVLALSGVPRLIGMLGGGAMADRRGARWVMIRADALRFAIMGAAAIALVIWPPTVAVIVSLAALLAFLGSFFIPAAGALRPRLLPDRHLVKGNALYLIGLRSGQAAGGPVGALLLSFGGIAAVALANAVSFLVSAFATRWSAPKSIDAQVPAAARAAPAAAQEPEPALRRIAAGWRFVLADRHLTALMAVVGLVELAGSGPLNLGLIFVSNSLGSGVVGAGLLLTAYTVGATAVFLLSLVWPIGRRAGPVAVLCTTAYAAILVGIGQSGSLSVAIALYGLLGVCSAQGSLIFTSMVQRRLPFAARARVMSILSLVIFGAVPLGNLTIGAMVQAFGVPITMAVQGAFALLGAVLFAGDRTLRRTSLA